MKSSSASSGVGGAPFAPVSCVIPSVVCRPQVLPGLVGAYSYGVLGM
jgi:hypothetical protein